MREILKKKIRLEARKCYGDLLNYTKFSLTHNHHDAEDLVSQAYIRFFNSYDKGKSKYKENTNILAYLTTSIEKENVLEQVEDLDTQIAGKTRETQRTESSSISTETIKSDPAKNFTETFASLKLFMLRTSLILF